LPGLETWEGAIALNYVAVFAAALVSWIAGAVWYVLLGRFWIAALGWTPEDVPKSPPTGPLALSFVAKSLMATALAALIGQLDMDAARAGLLLGFGCWLAFVATTICVTNAFERRSWVLSLIDSGHWFIVLMSQGLVLGHFS
jgi:hypothetical protein